MEEGNAAAEVFSSFGGCRFHLVILQPFAEAVWLCTNHLWEYTMKKVLYIHIGGVKTGTSALQNFLFLNYEKLLSEHDIYMPKEFSYKYTSKVPSIRTNLPVLFRDAEKNHEFTEHLLEYNDKNILLTDEIIPEREIDKELFCNLRNSLPEHDIKIILYLRRIDEQLKSFFLHSLKVNIIGEITNWPEYVKNTLSKRPSFMYQSEYIRLLASWVGKENVVVKLYDRQLLKNNSIIDDFMEELGIEVTEDFEQPHDLNESIHPQVAGYFSRMARTPDMKGITRNKLEHLGISVKKADSVPELPEWREIAEAEIEALDTILPGYKQLFKNKPVDFTFPELGKADPRELFQVGVMMHTLSSIDMTYKRAQKAVKGIDEASIQLQEASQQIRTLEKKVARSEKLLNEIRESMAAIAAAQEQRDAEVRLLIKTIKRKRKPFRSVKLFMQTVVEGLWKCLPDRLKGKSGP